MEGKTRATIEDLYRAKGKAELVQGKIVEMPRQPSPSGSFES